MFTSPFFFTMSETGIFLLILFAALLHASWNIIIKSITDSQVAMSWKMLIQSIIFFPILFFVPIPEGITWVYLVLSLLLHSTYFLILGSIFSYLAFEYYTQVGSLNTNLTLIGAGSFLIAIVLLITSVLLFSLVSVVREGKE